MDDPVAADNRPSVKDHVDTDNDDGHSNDGVDSIIPNTAISRTIDNNDNGKSNSNTERERSTLAKAMQRSAEATTRLMNSMWPMVRSKSYLRSDSYLSNVSSEGDTTTTSAPADAAAALSPPPITAGRSEAGKTGKHTIFGPSDAASGDAATVISVVVDGTAARDGRMWKQVQGGVDAFIESHKKVRGRAVYSVRFLDATVYAFKGANSVRPISSVPEEPEGCTLTECIQDEIAAVKKYQRKHPKFSQVVLLVFAAGAPASNNNTDSVRNIVHDCRTNLGWQITLIGADIDTDKTAAALSIKSAVNCSRPSVKDSFTHAAVASSHYRAYSQPSELAVDLTADELPLIA